LENWEYKAKDGRLITIRRAQPGDAPLLHNGFRSVVEEGQWLPTFTTNAQISDWITWIEKTYHCREILIMAFLADEYAGHLTLQPEEWNASQHVAKLGIIVRKECRNVGVGRALMQTSEEIASTNGYTKIILSTFEDNTIARDLYESLGYRVVGVRKNHFKMPKGFIDEVLMEKELSSSQ